MIIAFCFIATELIIPFVCMFALLELIDVTLKEIPRCIIKKISKQFLRKKFYFMFKKSIVIITHNF